MPFDVHIKAVLKVARGAERLKRSYCIAKREADYAELASLMSLLAMHPHLSEMPTAIIIAAITTTIQAVVLTMEREYRKAFARWYRGRIASRLRRSPASLTATRCLR